MVKKINVGIIGVGVISAQYLDTFERTDLVAVIALADLDIARATQVAKERGVQALTVAELLADPRIELVINLTVPAAHATIDHQIIAAGKHVYSEKPLALDVAEGQEILSRAAAAGVRVGSAPDTFLGTGIQTAIDVVVSGALGEVFAATAQWGSAGPELWHPNPDFYFQAGGGPVLDMGPYYLTALVQLLGPVRTVQASSYVTNRTRTIGAGQRAGEGLTVTTPTHATAILKHSSGALSTVILSFETWGHNNEPFFEVYGTSGSLRVPDPNLFSADVFHYDAKAVSTSAEEGTRSWEVVQPSAGYVAGGRGIGVIELAAAIDSSRGHRASGELALHVLEIMKAILQPDSALVTLETSVAIADLVPLQPLTD